MCLNKNNVKWVFCEYNEVHSETKQDTSRNPNNSIMISMFLKQFMRKSKTFIKMNYFGVTQYFFIIYLTSYKYLNVCIKMNLYDFCRNHVRALSKYKPGTNLFLQSSSRLQCSSLKVSWSCSSLVTLLSNHWIQQSSK